MESVSQKNGTTHSSSPQSTTISIPCIDLDDITNPTLLRSSILPPLTSACLHWGFFRIINHGIDICLMEKMVKTVEEFFKLDMNEKKKYESDNVMAAVRYGTGLNTPERHLPHWRHFLRHFGHPFHTSHLWPSSPSSYRCTVREYLRQIWELFLRLFSAVSESLGLNSEFTKEFVGEGCQIMAANYYPPCPESGRTMRLSAHSDHGGLTLLIQNDVDGLEIMHGGEWVAVSHQPGSILVNVGDCIEIMSNGRYKSVEHRAVVKEGRARISIAVGNGPALSTILRPAEALLKRGTKARYRDIAYDEYMKRQQISAERGKTPLQAIIRDL